MEKLMKRESDVFSQNSDEMDFNDVFGGPPKRFSMQERFSFESEDEKASSPWSGRKEKPVFGEEVRTRRRQNHQSDEFFNDIFKGVESYPSPRRSDRDSSSFGSNPGSRIMSPLPPKPDHFPTSLPAHFSLPAKVSKGAELPAFGSPLSRFSSRSNDHQSTPSYESCFEDSSTTKNEEKNAFNQFHFSIYKWASKGVPMLNDFKSNMDIRFTSSFRKKQQSEPPVDKQETKDSVVLEKEQVHVPLKKKKDSVSVVLKEEQEHVPVKKKTEPLNNLIHAFPHHQEVKDKKPAKTPRVDEIRNRKVERSSSLKLEEMSEKKKKSVEKGNVKDFVQIFNQESGDHVAAKDEKLAHVSYKVVEDLYKPQPQPSQPPSSAETIHTDSKENAADDPLDADNFMVEEIFDTEESVAESESTSDETKAIDAKIRQWAVGKKGNIRSLLSTLQYVLWAESGWKTVPLVDLIEANSVKRAYQKALLRLHPDKLQQKGASFHHKYTAEKVFDILQEAWDHFNTSSLTM